MIPSSIPTFSAGIHGTIRAGLGPHCIGLLTAMWFRRAADQGHAGVQFNLSTMYANGRGVPQDYVTAHMWANLAGARGDEEARELRDRLAEEMSAGKIAAAQRAAREWRPARQ